MRPVGTDERGTVVDLVLRSYAEYEPQLDPVEWANMTAALRRIVGPDAPGIALVATVLGIVVGTATYLPAGARDYRHAPQSWAVVRGMAVDPAWRGRGIGRRLLRECLRRASADGVPAVGLHTAAIMTAARAMYESEGFVRDHDFTHLGITFCVYARQQPGPG